MPKVETKTRVVMVRHTREAYKTSGTVRVAALALTNSHLIDYGEDSSLAASELPALDDAWLLFPDDDGPAVTPETPAPKFLIVLDGTWRQTRRMLRKLPALQGVPRLTLPEKPHSPMRLREAHTTEGRSTLEAVTDALELMGEVETAAPLRGLHDRFVEAVFRARGVWDLKRKSYEEAVQE